MTMRPRVLELGSYVAPAYAGMILAEQGCRVAKWSTADPILDLDRGDELWQWINHGKTITKIHASHITELLPGSFDIVIDNFRAETWERWGVKPASLSRTLGVTWVSLRADDDGRSFDVIAQARAWGDLGSLPFYIGDTAAGLWIAFKALASDQGHHIVRQATCLAKLIEGEGVVPRDETRPWDAPGTYGWEDDQARVAFRGDTVREPRRDHVWRADHLHHQDGRYVI